MATPATDSAALPLPEGVERRVLRPSSTGIATVGLSIVAICLILAIFAPLLAPFDPYDQDLGRRLIPPVWNESGTWVHPFGTDEFGRDYMSRLIYGARVSLTIGFCVTLIAGAIGTVLGVAAGYFGGRIDMVVTLLLTVRLAMPSTLVALAVVALIGSSMSVVILVLGLLMWDRFVVVMRAATQQVRAQEYIAAAAAVGCSQIRIVWREVMPNIMSPLIVVATIEFGHSILAEAALSFLGLGVQPPTPSWGLMVAEGKRFLLFESWLICIPGFLICALVLAINALGDAARDLLAPEDGQ